MTTLMVILGAMVGAPTRYLVDRTVQRRYGGRFPWGTMLVNVSGSLILGGLAGASPGDSAMALLGTGFCGALTTYSTFGYETIRLAEARAYGYALANVLVSLVAGIGAALLGSAATHWLLA